MAMVMALPSLGSVPVDPTSTPRRQEQQILRAAIQGDAAAFSYLYEQHKRRVFSLCLRMIRNRELAEDLTQETFLQVYRKLKTFRGDSAFSTWLHRIAVNVVLMWLRRDKGRLHEVTLDAPADTHDESSTGHFDTNGAEDPVLAGSVDRVALERAIASLPPGYALIFVLHDIEGYQHEEIAELLGCSVGNTKSQLHKARLKLRRHLGQSVRKRPLPIAA